MAAKAPFPWMNWINGPGPSKFAAAGEYKVYPTGGTHRLGGAYQYWQDAKNGKTLAKDPSMIYSRKYRVTGNALELQAGVDAGDLPADIFDANEVYDIEVLNDSDPRHQDFLAEASQKKSSKAVESKFTLDDVPALLDAASKPANWRSRAGAAGKVSTGGKREVKTGGSVSERHENAVKKDKYLDVSKLKFPGRTKSDITMKDVSEKGRGLVVDGLRISSNATGAPGILAALNHLVHEGTLSREEAQGYADSILHMNGAPYRGSIGRVTATGPGRAASREATPTGSRAPSPVRDRSPSPSRQEPRPRSGSGGQRASLVSPSSLPTRRR